MRFLIIATLIVLSFSTAFAQDNAAIVDVEPSTRIEVDNEAGVIRFIVKGKVGAVLMDDGLHVRESVIYGGVLTDTGREGFDDQLNAAPAPKDSGDAQ